MKISKIRLLAFVSTLLVSVDIIQLEGLRLTLIPLLLYGIVIVYKKNSIDEWFFYVVLFALASFPSVLNSFNQVKSFGYILWVVFNYFAISVVYKYFVVESKEGTLFGVRDAYRLQIIIGCFLYFLGIQERAAVLYYEPSYFALSLTPYVVLILYSFIHRDKTDNNKYISILDLVLILLALYTTKSANLMFVGLISVFVLSLLGSGKIKKLSIMFSISVAAASAIYLYSLYGTDLIATTFHNLLSSDNKLSALLDRTGNRWPRAQLTYDVAMSTFWGVGIGAFKDFTLVHHFPMYLGLPEYLSPIGYPPINIYFEIAATAGWLALFIWLLWHYQLLKKVDSKKFSSQVIVCSFVVAMIALSLESNFLRPYYWMLLGMVMGQVSLTQRERDA